MRLYLEYLASSLMNTEFLKSFQRNPNSRDMQPYDAAVRQIEGVLSTTRESLLGSGAWRQDFLMELQFRPFFMATRNSHHDNGERCEICGRSSHATEFKIHLFGTRYDARKMYDTRRWDNLLPSDLFFSWKQDFQSSSKRPVNSSQSGTRVSSSSSSKKVITVIDSDDDDDEDDEDEDDEEEPSYAAWYKSAARVWPSELMTGKDSSWESASHCRNRTQSYHTLLNYKLRLLLKVRDWIRRHARDMGTESFSPKEIGLDTAFVSQEADRFEMITSQAGAKWGDREDFGRVSLALIFDWLFVFIIIVSFYLIWSLNEYILYVFFIG